MKRKYWILAGHYRQFLCCIREKNINPNEALYVYDADKIRGLDLPEEIIKYGTYYENKEHDAIEYRIAILESRRNK